MRPWIWSLGASPRDLHVFLSIPPLMHQTLAEGGFGLLVLDRRSYELFSPGKVSVFLGLTTPSAGRTVVVQDNTLPLHPMARHGSCGAGQQMEIASGTISEYCESSSVPCNIQELGGAQFEVKQSYTAHILLSYHR